MKISITVEINETDTVFASFADTKTLSIDIAFNKYKFDILKDSQEKRLDYMAIEVSKHHENLLIGNTAYNLEEVLYLNNELKKYNLSLDTVYIPTEERIEKRKAEAIENASLHGRWIGSSEDEVEQNFIAFRATLKTIKDGLSSTSIKVVEA